MSPVGFLNRFQKPNPFKDPVERDKLSLKHLQKLGADLTLPRHVLHFVYFEQEADALRAHEEIPKAGWQTTLQPPDDTTPHWVVRAEATRVVDSHTVSSYRAWFEQIADSCNGEYDGWEAAAKP
jgi:hypothetical protein